MFRAVGSNDSVGAEDTMVGAFESIGLLEIDGDDGGIATLSKLGSNV